MKVIQLNLIQYLSYYVFFVNCDISHINKIIRILEPPYHHQYDHQDQQYLYPQEIRTTTEFTLPEIIINKNAVENFVVAHQPQYYDYNSQYIPPPSFNPPQSDDPNGVYLPPQVNPPQPPFMDELPDIVYLPASTTKPSLPPIANDPPPVNTYLPPNIPNNYKESSNEDGVQIFPSQAQGRVLKDNTFFRNSPSAPIRLELNDLRCLPHSNGYFRALLTIQNSDALLPVIEKDVQDLKCLLQMIRTQISIDIKGDDFQRCGVEFCGDQQLCLKIRFPQIQGLRTLTDSVLTLQCKVQERVVAKTHALRLGVSKDNQARNAGTFAQGGSQQPFHTQMGLYRQNSNNNGFTRTLEPGGIVQLGEKLMLRAHVKSGDGWNHTRISDVFLQRLAPNGEILNSATLITSNGCVHPTMKSICPVPPVFEAPLGHRLGFRAVMFQGMKSGDEMVMSVRIVGCIDHIDCFVDKKMCERYSTNRNRRETINHTADSFSDISKISFRVQMPNIGSNSSDDMEETNHHQNIIMMKSKYAMVAIIGTISIISLAAVIGFYAKYRYRR